MMKDQLEILNHKKKLIEEIKQIKKDEMFIEKPKEKISFFKKISIILNGRKKG